jgi:hypothetical protein
MCLENSAEESRIIGMNSPTDANRRFNPVVY